MSAKITGLSKLNVAAIRETMPGVETTATTATFLGTPKQALEAVTLVIVHLPGRGHPRASLHAVARKLRTQALNGRQDVPAQTLEHSVVPALDRALFGGQSAPKPEPAKCPNTGVTHPHRLRSICKDCGKEGAVNRGSGTLRAHQPLKINLKNLLTY